jgi:pyridoxine 4-dehydrogenase
VQRVWPPDRGGPPGSCSLGGVLPGGPGEARQKQRTRRKAVAFIPWFPVAAGKLARPGGKLDKIAQRHGATVAQLSIAWLLHRSGVMLPIPGTSSVAHLEENMQAAHLALSEAEMKEIEEVA